MFFSKIYLFIILCFKFFFSCSETDNPRAIVHNQFHWFPYNIYLMLPKILHHGICIGIMKSVEGRRVRVTKVYILCDRLNNVHNFVKYLLL